MPNHRNSASVGPNCTMNSQGRHYRDQTDPTNPVCDYESKGQRCEFYSSNNEFAQLPYPNDISLGPSAPNEGRNSEFAQIMELLQQQKQDSDRQIAEIKNQVNQLALGMAPASTSSTVTTQSIATTQVSMSTVTTDSAALYTPRTTAEASPRTGYVTPSRQGPPPHYVTNAASQLNSHLNSRLGHSHNLGYQPLTLEQLRRDPATSSNAEVLLQHEIRNVAPLNPSGAMGNLSGISLMPNQVSTVDQLYAATMRNKQLKAYEFAQTGQFSYKSQLKQDNLNAILFAYGSFKHLEAAKLGLINMSDTEFLARLTHLKNVFEIACLSSSLSSFSDNSWQIARE